MSSENRTPQVPVVGAGIAGLAAAGAIRELGGDVSVVEQRPGFDSTGTGLFVPANAVRALAALGVLDGVACRGRHIGRLRVHSADGHPGRWPAWTGSGRGSAPRSRSTGRCCRMPCWRPRRCRSGWAPG